MTVPDNTCRGADDEAAIERIVRPIVEGQIRDFLCAHPEVLTGVTRHLPWKKTATDWVKDSLSKRIVRDLACETTIARLGSALLVRCSGAQKSDGLALSPGLSAAEMAPPTVSADSEAAP